MTKTEELLAAIAAAKAAEAAYDGYESPDAETEAEMCATMDRLREVQRAAEAEVQRLRLVLIATNEPREWSFSDRETADFDRQTLAPGDVVEALESAIHGGDYGQDEHTVWIHARAYCELTDETIETTVSMGADEPACPEGEHDWQSPQFLGGLQENPGVFGHGGGVIITECCMHCGCKRVTDTWAQDMSTGEQGLTSIAYEPGAFAEELAALRSQEDD
jgi:hypothetical protein